MSDMSKFEKYLFTDWMIDLNFGLRALSIAIGNEDMGFSAVKAALEQSELNKSASVSFLTEDGITISNPESQIASFGKVSINGTMRANDDLCSYGIMHQVNALREMNANDSIKGVLIEMNTGGGRSNCCCYVKRCYKRIS